MKCDVCGSDNLEGAAYCEDCGAKLVVTPPVAAVAPPPPPVQEAAPVAPPPVVSAPTGAAVQCPSCGADNPSSEAYCVDCGANLGSTPTAPPAAVVPVVVPVAAPPAQVVATGARLELANGKQFSLDRELTTMGRRSPVEQIEPDIDLTDDDPESYVSRRHAQIKRENDQFIFEDVGSSNGSFINNARCNPGVLYPLKNGERVRLGKTEFVFVER